MATPPVLHAFDPGTVDPAMAGKIGLQVDAPPATVDQIVFYVASTSGAAGAEVTVNVVRAGVDGRTLIIDADSTVRYWTAKVHDTAAPAGYSGPSNEVSTSASAGPPPPPPPMTQVQHLEAALGGTYPAGCIVEVFPPDPTLSVKINTDGSIS